MKPILSPALTILALLAAGLLRAEAPPAVPAYPPFTVPGTEVRVLPRTRPDRLYELQIALPASFHDHPEKRYPVVFVTDGYWDFTTVVATVGNMVYGKNLPEMLVVGLGYAGAGLDYDKLRRDDLLPMVENGTGGGAAQFLAMIQTVVIPLLEKGISRRSRAPLPHGLLVGVGALRSMRC